MPLKKSDKKNFVNDKGKDQLKRWASSQRGEFTRLRNGLDSTLTIWQVTKLNEIGFEWTLKGDCDTNVNEQHEKIENELRGKETNPLWDCMFEKYKRETSTNTCTKKKKRKSTETQTANKKMKGNQVRSVMDISEKYLIKSHVMNETSDTNLSKRIKQHIPENKQIRNKNEKLLSKQGQSLLSDSEKEHINKARRDTYASIALDIRKD